MPRSASIEDTWRTADHGKTTRDREFDGRGRLNGDPVLSVVIPNYNHASIIPRAIASVLAQTAGSIEIIIVNDGSSDDSVEILQRIAAAHAEVRVIHHERNGGAPKALNTGLHAARGEFISFLGADDVALPGLYETMIAVLEANPGTPLACGEIVTFDTGGDVVGVRPMIAPATRARHFTPSDVRRMSRDSDNWICNTVTVYRRDALVEIGGFDQSLGAFCDGFLVRQLAFRSGFCFVPGIFGGWQVAAGTLSASSMLGRDENRRLTGLLTSRLAATPAITELAPNYPQLCRRRWRFNTARMHFVWKGAAATPAELVEAVGGRKLDLLVLSTIHGIAGFNRLGRNLGLAWLSLRMRPVSLPLLLFHSIRNRVMLQRHGKSIQVQIRELEMMGRRLT